MTKEDEITGENKKVEQQIKQQVKQKTRVQDSYEKAVKKNGNALKKLSEN
jgi:hypothetical protein